MAQCNWCLVDFQDFDETKIVDTLVVHSNNANHIRPRTCEQMYRDYCAHIKAQGNAEVLRSTTR